MSTLGIIRALYTILIIIVALGATYLAVTTAEAVGLPIPLPPF